MKTVSMASKGCILVNFLEKGEIINAAHYIQMLKKLCCALHEKHLMKKTVIFQHDKMRPHTACLTLQTIQKNGWELLSHPLYSLDLALSDYHLFRPLKDHLRGHLYETDKAVQEAVRSRLQGAGTDFYCRGIFKILQNWQKCIDQDGDFVEK
jgi:histone-lysine N-methyltransferase SETMAR